MWSRANALQRPPSSRLGTALSPWYRDKTQPSVADMLIKLRRVIIAAQFRRTHPQPATPAEIHTMRLAWAGIAA